MHSLTMSWSNSSTNVFASTGVSVQEGTTPVFTPQNLGANGNATVYVDQTGNLHAGPVGSYTWTAGSVSASCQYSHPAGKGQTTVTVVPNGCKFSFDNKTWYTSAQSTHPTGTNITQNIYVA